MASKWAELSESEDEYEEPVVVSKSASPVPDSMSISVSADDYGSHGVSPQPSPATGYSSRPPTGTIGFLSGVRYSASKDDVEKFLADHNVRIDKIELQNDANTGKFMGKAIIYCLDNANLLTFLNLDGASLLGMTVSTKVYEIRRQRSFNNNNTPRERGSGDVRNSGPPSGSSRGDRGDRNSGRNDRGDRRDNRGDRGDRGDYNRGGRSNGGRNGAPSISPIPGSGSADGVTEGGEKSPNQRERPRLILQPRTLPVESNTKPTFAGSDIFGGAKPRDEFEYEKKKQQEKEQQQAQSQSTSEKQEGTTAPVAEKTDKELATATESALTIDTIAAAAAGADNEPATGDSRRSNRSRGDGPNSNKPRKERDNKGKNSNGKPPRAEKAASSDSAVATGETPAAAAAAAEGAATTPAGSAGKKGQHVFTGAERKAKEHKEGGNKGGKKEGKGKKGEKGGDNKEAKKEEPAAPAEVNIIESHFIELLFDSLSLSIIHSPKWMVISLLLRVINQRIRQSQQLNNNHPQLQLLLLQNLEVNLFLNPILMLACYQTLMRSK